FPISKSTSVFISNKTPSVNQKPRILTERITRKCNYDKNIYHVIKCLPCFIIISLPIQLSLKMYISPSRQEDDTFCKSSYVSCLFSTQSNFRTVSYYWLSFRYVL